jgi:hypothetical protein
MNWYKHTSANTECLTFALMQKQRRPNPDFKKWLPAAVGLLWFATWLPAGLRCQPVSASPATGFVTITNIYLDGNRRTKPDVILRELDFDSGDTISLDQLTARLERNELNLMNTGLFTSARIYFKEWVGTTNRVGLQISVQESWYIFPFPIVELADRNFNVWWEDYNHSLRRLNLGVRFYHTNFTGRKDQLKLVGQVGFTKKYELIYTLPYFNKRRTLGLNLNFLHTREREIGYTTLENELIFHRNSEDVLLKRLRIGAGLLYRRRINAYHQLNLTFHRNAIHESIGQELNPDFFLDGLRQRYAALGYQFTLDRRDIKPYPMNGYLVSASLTKQGFGFRRDVDALNLSATFSQYFPIAKRWSAGFVAKGKTGLQRQKQPYYLSIALGYDPDYLRGYEFYVIDGLDFAFQKSSLRFELLNRAVNWGRYMRFDAFRVMPLKVFLSMHNELGYVNNPFYRKNNPLSNTLLWGNSLGLDVVVYYDKVFSLELSRNHLNEFGLFLHWTFSF